MFDPLLLDPDKVGLDPGTLVLELPGARMAQPFSRSNTLQSSAAGAGQRGSLGLVREEDSEAWAAGGGKRPEGASGLPTTGADDKVDGGRPGHGVDLEAGRGSGEAVPLPPVLLPLGRLPGIGVYYVDEQVRPRCAAGRDGVCTFMRTSGHTAVLWWCWLPVRGLSTPPRRLVRRTCAVPDYILALVTCA